MSLKAGAHQLNLTNSIEGTNGVKSEKGGNSDSQQLVLFHYSFVSRSQEKGRVRLKRRRILYPESAIQSPTTFKLLNCH